MGGKRKRSGVASEPRGGKKKVAVEPLPSPASAIEVASSPETEAERGAARIEVASSPETEDWGVALGEGALGESEWFEAATAPTVEEVRPRSLGPAESAAIAQVHAEGAEAGAAHEEPATSVAAERVDPGFKVPTLAGIPIGQNVSDPGAREPIDAAPRSELVAAAARVLPIIARPRPARRHRRPSPAAPPKWLEVVSGEVDIDRTPRPPVAEPEAPRVEVTRYATEATTTEAPVSAEAPSARSPQAARALAAREGARSASASTGAALRGASTGAALRGARLKPQSRGPGAFFVASLAAAGVIVAVGLQGDPTPRDRRAGEMAPARGAAIGAQGAAPASREGVGRGEANTAGASGEANAAGASREANAAGASREANAAGASGEANAAGASGEANAAGASGEANAAGAGRSEANAAGASREVAWRDEVGTIPVVRVEVPSGPGAEGGRLEREVVNADAGDVNRWARESGAGAALPEPAKAGVNAKVANVNEGAAAARPAEPGTPEAKVAIVNEGAAAARSAGPGASEAKAAASEAKAAASEARGQGVASEAKAQAAASAPSRGQVERAVAFREPVQTDPYPHIPPAAWAESVTVASQLEAARRYEGLPPRGFVDLSAAADLAGAARTAGARRTFYDAIPPLGGAEQRVVVTKRVEPTPSEPADPPAGKTADKVAATPRFYFQSEPSGAEVFIDGRRRGRTPLAVDLEPSASGLMWPAVEVLLVHPEFLPETLMLEPQRSARLVKVPLRRYAPR